MNSKKKAINISKVNRYMVLDSTTGCVKVIHATSKRQANAQFRQEHIANGDIACA